MPLTVQQWIAQQKGATTSSTPSTSSTPIAQNTPKMTVQQWIQKQQTSPAPIAPTPPPPQPLGNRFMKALGSTGAQVPSMLGQGAEGILGATKAIAQPLVNTGSAIESGLDETLGRAGNIIAGKGNKPTTTGAQSFASQMLAPKGTAEKAGGVVGAIAPYFTPEAPEAAATKAPEAVSFASKLASGVAKAAPGFARDASIATAQTKSLGTGLAIAAGGKVLEGVGALAKGIGKGIFKASIPVSDAEAGMQQNYEAGESLLKRITGLAGKPPTTAGDTAFRTKGMMGFESNIGKQAVQAGRKLWNGVISPALEKSTTPVDMGQFFDDAATQIKASTPELGDQSSRLEALDAIKDDYKEVGTASLKQLQNFKKGWASHVPNKVYNGKEITGAYNNVRNVLAGQARKQIYDALGPEVKQAYLDYGNMEGLKEIGKKARTGAKLKGGTGGFVSGLTEKVVVPAATIGGKAIYTMLGTPLEFVGTGGARTIQDILNQVDNPQTVQQQPAQ